VQVTVTNAEIKKQLLTGLDIMDTIAAGMVVESMATGEVKLD
jgi:hypothetical protein